MASNDDNCNLYLFGDNELYEDLFKLINSKNKAKNKNTIEVDFYKSTINISTKYYKTIINLTFIQNDLINVDKECKNDGIIVYYNEKNKILENLNKNKTLLEEYLQEKHLKLILLNDLNNLEEADELKKFSEEHDFDIIDLSSYDDEENGIDDLINALFVHEWSIIKKFEELKHEETEVIENEEKNDDFEYILSNLQNLRTKALELETNDRKLFAQEIVTKFWNSIKGDVDELEGLSDLSDID